MKQRSIGISLMALAAISLASASILLKHIPLQTNLQPGHVGIWRFTIAAPLLWVFTRKSQAAKEEMPVRRYQLYLLGAVFAVANFTALFSLERLPSSLYVIIIYFYPSLVVLYAFLTGKKVPKLFWVGLPLAVLGLFLVVYEFGSRLSIDSLGFFFTIINAIAVAAYMLISERLMAGIRDKLYATNFVLMGTMLAGWLMIPLFGVRLPDSAGGWLLLMALGIFGSLTPIVAMNIGLQLMGAARGSIINTLQPVVTVLVSTFFLKEELTPQQWLGGAIVIVAIAILQLSPDIVRKKESQSQLEQASSSSSD